MDVSFSPVFGLNSNLDLDTVRWQNPVLVNHRRKTFSVPVCVYVDFLFTFIGPKTSLEMCFRLFAFEWTFHSAFLATNLYWKCLQCCDGNVYSVVSVCVCKDFPFNFYGHKPFNGSVCSVVSVFVCVDFPFFFGYKLLQEMCTMLWVFVFVQTFHWSFFWPKTFTGNV